MLTWILFTFIILLCWKIRSDYRQRHFPPGPKRLPFIGHLWIIIKLRKLPLHLLFDNLLRKYGSIIGLKFFGQNIVILGDSALVKATFTEDNLSERFGSNNYFYSLSSGKGFKPAPNPMGVVFGTLWKDHRSFFLRHFRNSEWGKSYFEVNIHREIDDLMEIISNQHESILCINSDTFSITTLNVIWKIVAGIRFSHTDPAIKQMVLNLRKIMKMFITGSFLWNISWINKMFPRATKIDTYVDIMDSVKNLISCEINNHKNNINVGTPNDFIDSYLQAAQQNEQNSGFYSENELLNVCLDFFIAGFETTTTTLQWVILMMVLHPSVQCKVREEIKKNVDDNELLTMAHRPKLPYTMAVLSEVFRFGSIIPASLNHYATENITVLDYEIPKGSIVIASLYTIHHESGYWNDPKSFIPERFLNKEGIYTTNEHLVPFSVGKRKCLAEDLAQAEMFMIFGSLIRRFHFACLNEQFKPSLERKEGLSCEPPPFSVIVTDI